MDGFTIKDLSFKEGTDTLVLKIGGIDINANIKGSASCLWLFSGHFEAITIKNLTMVIEIATKTKDSVHFEIKESTYFHIDDF